MGLAELLNNYPKIMSFALFGAGFAVASLLLRYRGRPRPLLCPDTGGRGDEGEDASVVTGEYKMVLIVRTDLKMGKGKIAAQCAHAAVGAVEKSAIQNIKVLRHWQRYGQPKVVLKVDDEAFFSDLMKSAQSKNLITCLISDAGRTQIAPGSKTVLAVGPGPASVIDQVTGHLKLL